MGEGSASETLPAWRKQSHCNTKTAPRLLSFGLAAQHWLCTPKASSTEPTDVGCAPPSSRGGGAEHPSAPLGLAQAQGCTADTAPGAAIAADLTLSSLSPKWYLHVLPIPTDGKGDGRMLRHPTVRRATCFGGSASKQRGVEVTVPH